MVEAHDNILYVAPIESTQRNSLAKPVQDRVAPTLESRGITDACLTDRAHVPALYVQVAHKAPDFKAISRRCSLLHISHV